MSDGEDNNNKDNVTAFPDRKDRKKKQKEKVRILEVGNSNINFSDNTPIFNIPRTTKILIGIILAIHIGFFFLENIVKSDNWFEIKYYLSFVPSRYLDFNNLGFDALISPIAHMFLHSGWMHLLINIAILMAIGAGFERNVGGKKMLAIFFITGLCGALIHFLFYSSSINPLVGASGGISGLFGAFILQQQMTGLMGAGYKKLAIIAIIWSAVSILFALMSSGENIAWTAHLGGFWAGLFLYKPIIRRF